MIDGLKSRYWFTTKNRKRISIPLSQIESQESLEIIHEKPTGKYFIHVQVEKNWFPEEDRRRENQATRYTSSKGGRVIALDPGVRKFLAGYDPDGKSYIFGGGAHKNLTELLLKIDQMFTWSSLWGEIYKTTFVLDRLFGPYALNDEIRELISGSSLRSDLFRLWKKVKNLVSDLHWKVASFLVEHYDTILLPEFPIKKMVKGKFLPRRVKRLLYMFSFYQFRQKLQFKCDLHGKKLLIVDESFTSCTCGVCGKITRTKKEIFHCRFCGLRIDRDLIAARNILIKNSTYA